MRKLPIIYLFLFTLLCASCSLVKTASVIKGGKLKSENFYTTIPFEDRLGVMIVKVEIEGEQYDFMVDTGAPCVISKELERKLALKLAARSEVGDSQGNKAEQNFYRLPNLKVGGVMFNKIGVVAADLKKSKSIACLKIDGLIGSNLLRKAKCQFNYDRKEIVLTDDIEKLNIPFDAASKIDFIPNMSGTPKVAITVDGKEESGLSIDTGSNGGITASKSTYLAVLGGSLGNQENLSMGIGQASSGIYGGESDTTYYHFPKSIKLNGQEVPLALIGFKEKGSELVGNRFLRNFQMTIDWEERKIYLVKIADDFEKGIDTFGFRRKYLDGKLKVSFVYKNAQNKAFPIPLGSQILSIDGKDYSNMTDQKWCELIYEDDANETKEMKVVALVDGKEETFILKKYALME